jgi:RNA polymerase sigma-70 factor (ECF subfamily)
MAKAGALDQALFSEALPVHGTTTTRGDSTMMIQAADATLVELTLSGNETAFATLLERHERRFRHIAHKVLGMTQEADDAVQEAYISGYRKLGTLAQPERFASWMCRIIYNAAVMWLRRHRSRTVVPIQEQLDEAAEQGPSLGQEERAAVVRLSMQRLNANYQQVLRLKYEDQLCYDAIAERLGISKANVEKRLYRARRKLESVVRDHELFATAE